MTAQNRFLEMGKLPSVEKWTQIIYFNHSTTEKTKLRLTLVR